MDRRNELLVVTPALARGAGLLVAGWLAGLLLWSSRGQLAGDVGKELARAEELAKRSAWRDAVPILERLRRARPDDAEVADSLARGLANLGQFAAGAALLEELAERDLSRGDPLRAAERRYLAGEAWQKAERWRAAEDAWRAALAMEARPGVVAWQQECRKRLAGVCAVEHRVEDFLRITEETLVRALPAERLDLCAARTLLRLSPVEPKAAIAMLAPAVDADPLDVGARRAIAHHLLEGGRQEEAAKAIAALGDGDLWAVRRLAGRLAEIEGRTDALANLEDGLRPDELPLARSDPQYWRWRSLAVEREPREALKAAQRWAESATDSESFYRVAQLHKRLGEDAAFEKARLRAAELKQRRKDVELAFQAYQDKWNAEPGGRAALAVKLGELSRDLGWTDDAHGWSTVALAVDPTNQAATRLAEATYRPALAGLPEAPGR